METTFKLHTNELNEAFLRSLQTLFQNQKTVISVRVANETSKPLQLKSTCEKCSSTLTPTSEAYICTYECTFCPDCTTTMQHICPNCGGELVRRPKKGKVSCTL